MKLHRVWGWLLATLVVLPGCTMDIEERLKKLDKQSEANLKAGQEFLTQNSGKAGVLSTETGLQYKILKAGDGRQPQATDRVRVHYRGTLLDGTQFDSSYDRGEAAVFPVNRLIPGWTEALQLMKEGGHWQLFVPSNLAYGKKSPSTAIPPSSTLIFELELIAIES
ncbi:MAG: FKBP-type peptidyl-prolyl cis-trans isomerase [Motiliproteus sp.]|nr:FKBP-type peptidyl-prolyl cis-trans isomerase [Motiliproteus sp.]MCW9053345.1 FKBP-type peptidyl-prolyl cis-trans isomerase [Motiliproteus sp.]